MKDTINKIECYSCQEGSPIGAFFDNGVCPEGWTIDKNPCKSNLTNKYEIPTGDKVSLAKIMYKYKDVMGTLDANFSEFSIKKPTSNLFFDLYDTNFYDMKKSTHAYIIEKSEEYIGNLINPKTKEIEDLKEQIKRLQLQIDSTEREHPIFQNGTILMDSQYNQAYQGGQGGVSSGGTIRGVKWYMHSGKKKKNNR